MNFLNLVSVVLCVVSSIIYSEGKRKYSFLIKPVEMRHYIANTYIFFNLC